MPKYKIDDVDKETLEASYKAAKESYGDYDFSELDIIFNIACEQPDRFPGKNTQTIDAYMEQWVKDYHDARENPPSQREAKPRATCSDPAIQNIVKETQNMTDEEVAIAEKYHNLFMSAENSQGSLLEEYIGTKIQPYGFHQCYGNVLRAIDFCNDDGSSLLQIKNKFNTENSSSSSIREGTNIEKWFRLGIRKLRGVPQPNYKWYELNDIVNTHSGNCSSCSSSNNRRHSSGNLGNGNPLPACNMSEEDYQRFLTEKAKANPNLITDE